MAKKQQRILFTSAGRRIELIQAFRDAAAQLHQPLALYGTDLMTTAPALAFCDKPFQVCRIDNPDYIPQLLAICQKEQVDMLIPTIDTDLPILAENKKAFAEIGTTVLVSDPRVIGIANDKRNTYTFFREAGVHTPETCDDYQAYGLGFPAFIKPMDGSGSKDAYRVTDSAHLAELAKKVDAYIVQEFVDGEEFTVDAFCNLSGDPLLITPRRRTLVRAGEVLTTEIIRDEAVIKECQQILKELKAVGPVTIQYIKQRETGKNYFIEINPRFGGGSPLSVKAGARSPELLLRLLAGETVEPDFAAADNGAVYARFDQSVCMTAQHQTITDIKDAEDAVQGYEGIIFDLDDTLYNERDYVASGFRAVADMCPEVPDAYERLMNSFSSGQPAIDVLVKETMGGDEAAKQKYLATYRSHTPTIELAADTKALLVALRAKGKKLGVITDGRVEGQRAKITALGLSDLVDEIIITDELAGKTGDVMNFRKPNSIAFSIMQRCLGVPLNKMVYVADNSAKDFHACRALGFAGVHYRNKEGLYA